MSAIITITFNPALDKSVSIPLLVPEKKLKCSAPVYEPGGGGINVARAITKLGGDATAVYLAGGYAGQKITSLLHEEGVRSVVIETRGSTRENVVVADTGTGKQYLFDMTGEKVDEAELDKLLHAVEVMDHVQYIVASGSLPPGVPTDIFARVALLAKQKNAKLIADTSGEALKQAVNAGVYLIKPNLRELGLLVGNEDLKIEMVADAARQIINMNNCEVVVASLGDKGAMLITGDIIHRVLPPPANILSTVGAGDSLVAGIVLSLENGRNLLEAVQYGVACGTAATLNPGTQLCSRKDADHLYEIIRAASLVKV